MLQARSFSAPGGRICYWVDRAERTAPWLVFLPGLTADHRLFGEQLAAFSGRYNCLAWDPPAHGASRPYALDFSMGDLADLLEKILRAEGAQHPVLVGQSMGGYVAQAYMARYPGAAGGFIAIDSCPLERSYYTAAELFLLRHTYGIYRAIPWRWLLAWGPAGCSESETGRALMRRMMQEYRPAAYCALAAHGYRILADAVEAEQDYTIRCPALLLWGQKDAAGSARRYNRAWARRTGYPSREIPGAGHNANTDRPDLVNAAIEDFLRGLAGPV